MTKYEVLNQLNQKELNSKEAYKLLYQLQQEPKARRAIFIKIRLRVPESKGATILLSTLLFLPMPIFLVKMFVPRKYKESMEPISDQLPITPHEMIKLVSIHGIKIDVKTHDGVRVYIKTI